MEHKFLLVSFKLGRRVLQSLLAVDSLLLDFDDLFGDLNVGQFNAEHLFFLVDEFVHCVYGFRFVVTG